MDDRRPLVLMLILANVAGVMISLLFKSYQDRMRSRNSSESIKSHSSLRILTRNRQVETSPQSAEKNVSPLTKRFERSPATEHSPHIEQRLAPTRGSRSIQQDVRLSPIQKPQSPNKKQPPTFQPQSSTNHKPQSPTFQKPQSLTNQKPQSSTNQKPQSPTIQKSRWPLFQKQRYPLEPESSTSPYQAPTPVSEIKRKRSTKIKRNVPAVREESLMMTPNAFRRLPDENTTNEDEPRGFYVTAMDLLHHLEPLLTKPTCPPRKSVDPMDTSRKHFYEINEDSESTVIDDSRNELIDDSRNKLIDYSRNKLIDSRNGLIEEGTSQGAKTPKTSYDGYRKGGSSKSIPAGLIIVKEDKTTQPETSQGQSSRVFSTHSKSSSPKREPSIPRAHSEEIQLYKIVDGKKGRLKTSPSKPKNRFSFLEPPQEKDEFFIKEKISPESRRIPSRSRLSGLLDDTKNGRNSPIKTFEQISSPKIRSPPAEHQPKLYRKVGSPPLRDRTPSFRESKSPEARKSIDSYNVEGLGKKGESKHPSLLSDTSLHDRDLSQRRSTEKLIDLNKKYFEKDDEYKFVSTTITRPPEFLEIDEKTDRPDTYGRRNADSPELRCCRGLAISKDKFFDFKRRPKVKEVKKSENLIKYDVIKPIPSLVQSNQVNDEIPKSMVKEKEDDRSVNFKQN